MLYVGDCGGEETLGVGNSVLSSRRRTPATDDGWEVEIGKGPCLAANFVLNEGTLKLGAGGEALLTSPSEKVDAGELGCTCSVRVGTGIACGLEDV